MTFLIHTLGCKVNTYESDVMRDIFVNNGYTEAINSEPADVVVINTCTVTNTADSKSLKVIRGAIKKNPGCILIVTGCFSQVNSEALQNLDGVSIILGNYNKSNLIKYIETYKKEQKQIIDIFKIDEVDFECMQLNNFSKTRAFVKIEDGCENFCTYCIIPYSRGKVRSKKREDVLNEITALVHNGHSEVVLTGIHTGHYGADLENYTFAQLLEEICLIDGLERLRISSIEITELDDDFLKVLENNPKIVDHLHIPLQSGCDKTLKAMNRKYDMNYFINKVNQIRAIRPEISLSTDLIAGFPGETEEDFSETKANLQKIEFTKIHVFPFSLRKGTKAEELPDHLSESAKKERVHQILEISKELEIKYMEKYIGRTVEFLPEVSKNGYLIGHTGNYLLIKYQTTKELTHEMIKCKIEKLEYPYLMGEEK